MRCASSQDLSSFAVVPTAVVRAVRLGWYVVQRLSLWQSHLSELTAEHREAEKLRQDHGTQHVWNENRWRKKFERIGHGPLGVDFPQPLVGSHRFTMLHLFWGAFHGLAMHWSDAHSVGGHFLFAQQVGELRGWSQRAGKEARADVPFVCQRVRGEVGYRYHRF